MKCYPATDITESSILSTQLTQQSTDTGFVLPELTPVVGQVCSDSILTVVLTTSTVTLSPPAGLNAPVLVNSRWVVKPTDNSLHQSVNFYAKVTTTLGFVKHFPTSGIYTLKVGCLANSMTSTPSGSFTSTQALFVGD